MLKPALLALRVVDVGSTALVLWSACAEWTIYLVVLGNRTWVQLLPQPVSGF
jgi:hypothetical protein